MVVIFSRIIKNKLNDFEKAIVGFVIILSMILTFVIYLFYTGEIGALQFINSLPLITLAYLTAIYVYHTSKIAQLNLRQMEESKKQNKIRYLEKQLEKIYSPIVHTISVGTILYETHYKGKEGGNMVLLKDDFDKLDSIFQKYRHLIKPEIYKEWVSRTADKENVTKGRINVPKGTLIPLFFYLQNVHNWSQKEIDRLKKEYENLIK